MEYFNFNKYKVTDNFCYSCNRKLLNQNDYWDKHQEIEKRYKSEIICSKNHKNCDCTYEAIMKANEEMEKGFSPENGCFRMLSVGGYESNHDMDEWICILCDKCSYEILGNFIKSKDLMNNPHFDRWRERNDADVQQRWDNRKLKRKLQSEIPKSQSESIKKKSRI